MSWDLHEAVLLAKQIEGICPKFGCHIALTGGCLYKDGQRKDLDLLIYRIRQVQQINYDGLFSELEKELGIKKASGFGWCYKLKYRNRNIDLFDPEELGGEEYPEP